MEGKINLQRIHSKLSTFFPSFVSSLLFNKKNKKISKYTVFLEFLVITSFFISFNTCYYFVWTKYTYMVEAFEFY